MNTKYGEVRNEEAPLLSQNTRKKSEHSGYTIKAAGAAILLIGSLAVAQSTQQRRTAQGRVRLGDALDDAKAGAFVFVRLFAFVLILPVCLIASIKEDLS